MSEIELHRKLLGDKVRNDALHTALMRTIKPGMTVAAIGAGTGFLSFLARRLGAAHCHLYEYSPALSLAQQLARDNDLTGLTFVNAHSSEVRKPPKADVVLSETLGNFALEEGLLETLVDARRFLKPGGAMLPRALKQFVAPVVTPRLQHEIDVWRGVGHDLNLSAARELALNNMYVKAVRPEDLPGEKAAQVWDDIVFDGRDKPSSKRQGQAAWPAKDLKGATVHGFALWWEAELVPNVSLTTSPYAPATHWEQVYLPLLEPLAPEPKEALELQLRSETGGTVRLIWESGLRQLDGKLRGAQRQDLLRGRL
jgi:ubiquinone/menaquinone biosynthesis C-methylase UbiE